MQASYEPAFDISTREGVARMLADKVCENNLGVPYGGYAGKQKDLNGRVRHLTTFARTSALDGTIEVYGIDFIKVWWNSIDTGYDLWEGSRIFSLWEDAWEFLRLAFVEYDREASIEVPLREETEVEEKLIDGVS